MLTELELRQTLTFRYFGIILTAVFFVVFLNNLYYYVVTGGTYYLVYLLEAWVFFVIMFYVTVFRIEGNLRILDENLEIEKNDREIPHYPV